MTCLQVAADADGINKSTILRAHPGGQHFRPPQKEDQRLVEPAELCRLYPPAVAGNQQSQRPWRWEQSEFAEANAALWSEVKVSLCAMRWAFSARKSKAAPRQSGTRVERVRTGSPPHHRRESRASFEIPAGVIRVDS